MSCINIIGLYQTHSGGQPRDHVGSHGYSQQKTKLSSSGGYRLQLAAHSDASRPLCHCHDYKGQATHASFHKGKSCEDKKGVMRCAGGDGVVVVGGGSTP